MGAKLSGICAHWVVGAIFTTLTVVATVIAQADSLTAQVPGAYGPNRTAQAGAEEKDPFGRETPHGCVVGFLKAAERGDYTQATQYLDTRPGPKAEELARQLHFVLNHGLSETLDKISRNSEGDLKDGLKNNRDQVGHVRTSEGTVDIFLDRLERRTGPPVWLFSSESLRQIPEIAEEYDSSGIESLVPPGLQVKVLSVPLWRWLVIAFTLCAAIVLPTLIGRVLVSLLRVFAGFAQQKTSAGIVSMAGPVRLILLALLVRLLSRGAISVFGRTFWTHLSVVLAVVGISWILIRIADVWWDNRTRRLRERQATAKLAGLSLARRLVKIFIIFSAVVLLLRHAGVNVSGVLAGLGIGGIAIALAAQKTLEDVFGGISIIMRNAIRVGDSCKVGDETGVVEDISLGSTTIRTADRAIVTIPNARVSQSSVQNYSMRDRYWFHHVLQLRCDTPTSQVRKILNEVREHMQTEFRLESESARIRFTAVSALSLNLEVSSYILVTDYAVFLELQENLLLRIMDIIEANGASIATPLRAESMYKTVVP